MTPPEDARWVSKQTFLELWEHNQKTLTQLQQAESDLREADKMVGWLASEVVRLSNLAREYSKQADDLRCAYALITSKLGTPIKGDDNGSLATN